MRKRNRNDILQALLTNTLPQAFAFVKGNHTHPTLEGSVRFYAAPFGGVLIQGEFFGLPVTMQSKQFFGFHIHEYGDCSDDFANTGSHYNPAATAHPTHAGDLPPLLATDGYAWTAFYDGVLTIDTLLGRSIVIHSMRDDFTTQPSGDSGDKIGCGVISRVARSFPNAPATWSTMI